MPGDVVRNVGVEGTCRSRAARARVEASSRRVESRRTPRCAEPARLRPDAPGQGWAVVGVSKPVCRAVSGVAAVSLELLAELACDAGAEGHSVPKKAALPAQERLPGREGSLGGPGRGSASRRWTRLKPLQRAFLAWHEEAGLAHGSSGRLADAGGDAGAVDHVDGHVLRRSCTRDPSRFAVGAVSPRRFHRTAPCRSAARRHTCVCEIRGSGETMVISAAGSGRRRRNCGRLQARPPRPGDARAHHWRPAGGRGGVIRTAGRLVAYGTGNVWCVPARVCTTSAGDRRERIRRRAPWGCVWPSSCDVGGRKGGG